MSNKVIRSHPQMAIGWLIQCEKIRWILIRATKKVIQKCGRCEYFTKNVTAAVLVLCLSLPYT